MLVLLLRSKHTIEYYMKAPMNSGYNQ